jgi:hypothetical protein
MTLLAFQQLCDIREYEEVSDDARSDEHGGCGAGGMTFPSKRLRHFPAVCGLALSA